MFLSAYHFEGDPAVLTPAYEVLRGGFPPEALQLHVCVVAGGGITVYDACPSREVFEEFSRSAEFAAAVRTAGLPPARIEPLGEVHHAFATNAAVR